MTMEVEINPDPPEEGAATPVDTEIVDIVSFLTHNDNVFFKSQQKWEADLSTQEKTTIALDVFGKSKLNFLIRFGKYLTHDQLQYFRRFTESYEPDNAEIDLVLKDLCRNLSENAHHVSVKNRRYAALLQMVEEDSYFSEIEMMKRNPLLYEQLVGQYLTQDEKRERDKYKLDDDQVTFVKILMEGIERDNAELVRRTQEEKEDNQMAEDTSDEDVEKPSSPIPSFSRWGEFEENKVYRPKQKCKTSKITAQERVLLKEEFITSMYQNFLDGKDEDFNYDSVDNNASYDNVTEIDHDEEDKYFASEDPEEVVMQLEDQSSEDELDMYMNALNQHPAVNQLSKDMKKL